MALTAEQMTEEQRKQFVERLRKRGASDFKDFILYIDSASRIPPELNACGEAQSLLSLKPVLKSKTHVQEIREIKGALPPFLQRAMGGHLPVLVQKSLTGGTSASVFYSGDALRLLSSWRPTRADPQPRMGRSITRRQHMLSGGKGRTHGSDYANNMLMTSAAGFQDTQGIETARQRAMRAEMRSAIVREGVTPAVVEKFASVRDSIRPINFQ